MMQTEWRFDNEFFAEFASRKTSDEELIRRFQVHVRLSRAHANASLFGPEWDAKQAVANGRIEGFVPDARFKRGWAALLAGEISDEEFRARSLAAAKLRER